jgi:outer membrane protein assembly factor BamB
MTHLIRSMLCSSLSLLTFHIFAFPEPQAKWTLELEQSLSSSPLLYEENGTPNGFVLGAGGRAYRVDGSGNLVWKRELGDPASRGGIFDPIPVDLENDGRLEIIAGHNDGHLFALEGDSGETRWEYDLGAPLETWRMAVAEDLDGDDLPEIVATDMEGWVTCLKADGTLHWRSKTQDYRLSTPSIADIDTDGEPEIVFGSATRYLTALNADGTFLWESFQPPLHMGRTKPLIADLDLDGRPEVLSLSSMIAPDTGLVCVNGSDGSLKWTAPTWHKAYQGLNLIQFSDASLGVLAVDKANNVGAHNADGSLRWRTQVKGRGIWTAPVVADLNGNGTLEVVVTCRDRSNDGKANNWYVLDADTGQVLGAYSHGNGQYGGGLVADVDSDGTLELILVSQDGKVTAFTFGGAAEEGSILAGNWLNSYFPLRAGLPQGPEADRSPEIKLLPDNLPNPSFGDLRWKVQLPEGITAGKVLLEVRSFTEDGPITTRVFREEDPESTSIGVMWSTFQMGKQIVGLRLLSSKDFSTLGHQRIERQIGDLVAPLQTHENLVLTELQKARKVARETHPESEITLARRITDVESSFHVLRDKFEKAPQLTDAEKRALSSEVDEFLGDMSKSYGFLALWKSEIETGRRPGIAVWEEVNPWDNHDPTLSLPLQGETPLIRHWAFGNETESVCANILNLSPDPLTLRVDPGTLTAEGEQKLPKAEEVATLMRPVFLPSRFGETVPDLLPELGPGYLLDIAPGEVRQLWINIDTTYLEAGDYRFSWLLRSLDADPATKELVINFTVSSVRLPEKSRFLANFWSQNEIGDFSTVPDLNEHLQTIWYRLALPPAQVDAEGNLIGELDWTSHDKVISQANQIELILYSGFPAPKFPECVEPSEELMLGAQRNYFESVLEHHKQFGLGYENFMIYVEDETGLTGGIEHFMERAREIKKIDPRLQVYANPWGSITAEDIREMWEVTDVWQPGMETIEYLGDEYLDAMRPGGKRIATYTPPGNCRILRPLGFYRGQAWLALHWGITGGGWWVYHGTDLWATLPSKEPDFGAVAWDGRELVTSRRWEANRDGIEDFNAVAMLQDLLAEKPDDQAQKVLDEAIAFVVKETLTGMPREAADYDFDYSEFMNHRTAIREALERVSRQGEK